MGSGRTRTSHGRRDIPWFAASYFLVMPPRAVLALPAGARPPQPGDGSRARRMVAARASSIHLQSCFPARAGDRRRISTSRGCSHSCENSGTVAPPHTNIRRDPVHGDLQRLSHDLRAGDDGLRPRDTAGDTDRELGRGDRSARPVPAYPHRGHSAAWRAGPGIGYRRGSRVPPFRDRRGSSACRCRTCITNG